MKIFEINSKSGPNRSMVDTGQSQCFSNLDGKRFLQEIELICLIQCCSSRGFLPAYEFMLKLIQYTVYIEIFSWISSTEVFVKCVLLLPEINSYISSMKGACVRHVAHRQIPHAPTLIAPCTYSHHPMHLLSSLHAPTLIIPCSYSHHSTYLLSIAAYNICVKCI